MDLQRASSPIRLRAGGVLLMLAVCAVLPNRTDAQGLTGTLLGTVRDEQGGVLRDARVAVSSPALIGGPLSVPTNERGQWLFAVLAPGTYILQVERQGFATYREGEIHLGAGATIERTVTLRVETRIETVVVEGTGSTLEARGSGFETRVGRVDLQSTPTRRASMFDAIRSAPGISPTSPSSGITTTVSAFGSGTNENLFLIDDTNFTCPCNGVARSEPGVDFIQEVQVQSVGASAEFGNMQGAVFNVVTRSGSNRFLYDAAYYGQPSGLTSQSIQQPMAAPRTGNSGYERDRYRDVTTNLGGPIRRDRLWFFAGYQHLRDYDSQPGADPTFPRTFQEDKTFAKLTWRLGPSWQLVQSVHYQYWVNPDRPTVITPFETTTRVHASVPAATFGHLTHTVSDRTLWDVRVGRFIYSQESPPSTGDYTTPNRIDRATNVASGGPAQFGSLTIMRTTAKATVSHFRPGPLGTDHAWKAGAQIERGEHDAVAVIPTGVRYEDRSGLPFQAVSSDPSVMGGAFVSASVFASDAVTVGDGLTINAGLRYDYNRAISQDLFAVDLSGRETGGRIPGLGTLYTWHVFSPRLGLTWRLSADGRAFLRASYGRFSQGVLTGELGSFHPGAAPVTTTAFDAATGGYTTVVSTVDPLQNLRLDRETRAPTTDEYSIGVDREIGRRLVGSVAYVHKNGRNFIGWTDIGGVYRESARTLADGRSVPVFELTNRTADRVFFLTNPDGYSLRYDGLVMAVEKRRSQGWHARGSYAWSKTFGLLPSSGATAGAPQVSTVAPPAIRFGRDPNDLTNATGRLPNDRPHIFRLTGSVDVPRTGVVVAANVQYFSGKPWASTAQIVLPQGNQRVFLEPRGTRRLTSQKLLDLRVSRRIPIGGLGRADLILDVLNALNNTSEEDLATDDFFSQNFGKRTVFVDPRRAMFGVRVNLGQ